MSNKWNEERVALLTELAGDSSVTQAMQQSIADSLEVTKRSVASKLRKMGYDVEKVAGSTSTFSSEQEDSLRAFLASNHGTYTYAEIADKTFGGEFSAKQVQGKILSMELTGCVAPSAPKASVSTYTEAQTQAVIDGAANGDYIEDIVAATGKALASVRGKALSLLRAGIIGAIPSQKNKVAAAADIFEGIVTTEKTAEELAEIVGKTVRGVKTMLTNRKLSASDYVFKEKESA